MPSREKRYCLSYGESTVCSFPVSVIANYLPQKTKAYPQKIAYPLFQANISTPFQNDFFPTTKYIFLSQHTTYLKINQTSNGMGHFMVIIFCKQKQHSLTNISKKLKTHTYDFNHNKIIGEYNASCMKSVSSSTQAQCKIYDLI